MDTKQFFKDVYEDFFGVEKIKAENEKLAKELGLNQDYPTIELNKQDEAKDELTEEQIKETKDEFMLKAFEKLEKLYITEQSKNTLKKIIEYMRKYSEGIEKQYIPFNMCIYSNNKETMYSIVDIISDTATFFSYIKRGTTIETSFYNIEKPEQIEEIYSKKNSVVVLKDFEGLLAKEKEFKDRFLHNMKEKLEENQKDFLTILISKTPETIEQAMQSDMLEKYFEFKIESTNIDVQDVYQEVLGKLKESSKITDEASIKLLDYIAATYPKTNLSFPEYRDKLCNKILFSKDQEITENDLPKYEQEKSMDEIFADLNNLVGLENIKQVLKDLVDLIELKNKTKDDLKIKDINLHMVFLGNPGTGKTTVARIIAEMLYNLKYIKQNKLIEVSSKDLVAEYVGQTAPKTMAVIERALGGVLFVDEAYSLASEEESGNSFNKEAIATLIQAMENYRDNLVVIFAGYTKEMQAFLNANSGIVSRIGYTLDFKDYTSEELLKIFEGMVKKAGFSITKEACDEVVKVIDKYRNTKNFGNARFARNLYEKTIIKHASNTRGKKAKKDLKTIVKEDISTDNL
ncbi:stage V sporulation protein K [Clostridium sp. CAG:567]|nr:stage V sporulation protein K [Clostridium sp. CAG:567]